MKDKKRDRSKIRKFILCGQDQASSPIPCASPQSTPSPRRNKTPASQRSAYSSASTLSIVSKRAKTPTSQRSAYSSTSTLSIVSKGATVEIPLKFGIPGRINFLLNRLWREVSNRPAPASITGRKVLRHKHVQKDNTTLSVVVEGTEGCLSPRPSSSASAEIERILSKSKLPKERTKSKKRNKDGTYYHSPCTASLPRVRDEDVVPSAAAEGSDDEDEELKNLKSHGNTPAVSPEPVGPESVGPEPMASRPFAPYELNDKAQKGKESLGPEPVASKPFAPYELGNRDQKGTESPMEMRRGYVSYILSPPPSSMDRAPSRGPSRSLVLPVATKKYTPSRKKHVVVPPENRQEVVNKQWPGWKEEFNEKMAKRDQIADGGLAYWVGDENAAKDKPKKKTSDGPGFIRRVLSKFKKSGEESSQPQGNEQPSNSSSGPEISKHVPHPPPGPAPARKKGNKGEKVPHPPAGPKSAGRKARVSTTSSDKEIATRVPHPPAGPSHTQRRVRVKVNPGVDVTAVNPKPLAPGECHKVQRKDCHNAQVKSYAEKNEPEYDSVEQKSKHEKPRKVKKSRKAERELPAETYTVYDIPGTYGEVVDVGVEVCNDLEYAPARSYEENGQDFCKPKNQKPKKQRQSRKTREELLGETSCSNSTPSTTVGQIVNTQRRLYKTEAQKILEKEQAILRRAKMTKHTPFDEYLASRKRDEQNLQFFQEVTNNNPKKPKKKKKKCKSKSKRQDEAAVAEGMERDPYPQHAVDDNSPYHYRQQTPNSPENEEMSNNGRTSDHRITAERAANNMDYFLRHSQGKL